MKTFFKENILYIAVTQALIATVGSLYFSEVRHFIPCILCWYQRICLYPLIPVLLAGIIQQNKKIHWYILPLSSIGLTLSVYQNLLYYKIIPEAIAPCQTGVSCTTKYIEYFGIITIPFLSFIAFAVITACMIGYMMLNRNHE